MGGMKRSNTQRLRDALENAILNGDRIPGERLDPEALGQEFNVSRTPVREAIHQLVASGLVSVQPKKGTFVAEVGIDRLIEMFEVMAELEGMCGRLAARRITVLELGELRDALKRCEQAAGRGDGARTRRLRAHAGNALFLQHAHQHGDRHLHVLGGAVEQKTNDQQWQQPMRQHGANHISQIGIGLRHGGGDV